jgi:uncharacterized protein (UPF0264 family)
MPLLVSLRSGDEVADALAGGADIIDAKEPANGSLGAVAPTVLREIAALVPATVPFSVALGDLVTADAVAEAVAGCPPPRHAPLYLKLGFAGKSSPLSVKMLVAAALDVANRTAARPVIVPVAYADWSDAGSLAPEEVLSIALSGGARAFLLDTYIKEGHGLFDRMDYDRVRALAARGREAGLLMGIAGSLDLGSIERAARLADVVGVRGAACVGGRGGRVEASLVRRLREVSIRPVLAEREGEQLRDPWSGVQVAAAVSPKGCKGGA